MENAIKLHYDVAGGDFVEAGTASGNVKKVLSQIGIDPAAIRRTAIAMYEGEINMVIHANGGTADVEVTNAYIEIVLRDNGPGIKDINLAMQAGYSTASQAARDMGFGAGMGLPNMKRYSDFIDIETELGKGTTVKMIIKTRS